MKIRQLVVFTVFFTFSLLGFAASGGVFDQATPQQSYQSASDSAVTPVQSPSEAKPAVSGGSQMAKVESIMRQSKSDVHDDSDSSSHAAVDPKVASKRINKPSSSSNTTVGLQSQLSQLNQEELFYQQTTNQKLQTLTTENQALKVKMAKLTEALVMINHQPTEMKPKSNLTGHATLNADHTQQASTSFQQIKSRLQGVSKYLAIAVVVLLAALMFVLFRRKKAPEQPVAAETQADHDTNDEYDFMSSREALPAKLDLARTYLEMGDEASARTALEEVIRDGDKRLQQIAKDLLSQFEDKT